MGYVLGGSHRPRCVYCEINQVTRPGDICRECERDLNTPSDQLYANGQDNALNQSRKPARSPKREPKHKLDRKRRRPKGGR